MSIGHESTGHWFIEGRRALAAHNSCEPSTALRQHFPGTPPSVGSLHLLNRALRVGGGGSASSGRGYDSIHRRSSNGSTLRQDSGDGTAMGGSYEAEISAVHAAARSADYCIAAISGDFAAIRNWAIGNRPRRKFRGSSSSAASAKLPRMCYSALVRQDIHELARRYGAEIAYEMFAEHFAAGSVGMTSRQPGRSSRTSPSPNPRRSNGSRRKLMRFARAESQSGKRISSFKRSA